MNLFNQILTTLFKTRGAEGGSSDPKIYRNNDCDEEINYSSQKSPKNGSILNIKFSLRLFGYCSKCDEEYYYEVSMPSSTSFPR